MSKLIEFTDKQRRKAAVILTQTALAIGEEMAELRNLPEGEHKAKLLELRTFPYFLQALWAVVGNPPDSDKQLTRMIVASKLDTQVFMLDTFLEDIGATYNEAVETQLIRAYGNELLDEFVGDSLDRMAPRDRAILTAARHTEKDIVAVFDFIQAARAALNNKKRNGNDE